MPKLFLLIFCISAQCATLTYAADINNTDCEKETKKLRETPTMVKADEARNRKDINGEIKYLKIAIQENNPWAKMMLGLIYKEGKNTPKNDSEAIRLIKSAAEQGYCQAQATLGYSYESGTLVIQNYAEALRWYKAGASQGFDTAWFFLSLMYKDGKGTPRNYVKAHMWMNLYTARGHVSDFDIKTRDELEKSMTQQQVNQAHKLAAQCLASNFKQCD
jgi:TPR repeat protein